MRKRFRVERFKNPSGQRVWRVSGIQKDGSRIRENYKDQKGAGLRCLALETEYHTNSDANLQATRLTHDQLVLSETACNKLGVDWPRLLDAVDLFLKEGKKAPPVETPRLDNAKEQFEVWVEKESGFRERTQANLKLRVDMFSNGVPNLRLAEISPDVVEKYLGERKVSKVTRENDRRALSRFFAWCIHPMKWISTNPAKKQVRERQRGRETLPSVLTVQECRTLLAVAEGYKNGRLVPYLAICLFGALRPNETARLRTNQINLGDREITLEPWQSKTHTPRTVKICDTLAAWLEAYKGLEIYPANWRKAFDAVRQAAGFAGREWKTTAKTEKGKQRAAERKMPKGKIWPVDVLRHTAISHYFRKTGSYGETAEQFGNSEGIIKRHYQGRVTSADMAEFYELRPSKKGGAK